MTKYSGFAVTKEFRFINVLRAMAAFWVLLAHCMIWGGWQGIPLPSPKLAVDLFMIISGYLMAANAVFRDGFEPMNQRRSWVRFWLRRFFRLAPAYWLALVLAVLLQSYFLGGYQALRDMNAARWLGDIVYDPARIEFTASNLAVHFTFVFGLLPDFAFSTFLPDWSLSLEMQFYAVFPFMFLLFRRAPSLPIIIAVAVISRLLGIGLSRLVHYPEPSLLLFKLQYFIAGYLMFAAFREDLKSPKQLVLLLCAVLMVCTDVRYGLEMLWLPVLVVVMAAMGLLEKSGAPLPILNNRLIRFASDVSYGVYLFHGFFIAAAGLAITNIPAIAALPALQRGGLMLAFVMSGSYLFAWMIFSCVETPGIALGKRVIARLFAPARPGHATPHTDS